MYIKINKGLALPSVDLSLDLGLYCRLARPLYLGLVPPDQALPAEIAHEFFLLIPTSALPSYEAAFQAARQIMEEQLAGFAGCSQWVDIEKLLRTWCQEITKSVSPAAACQVLEQQCQAFTQLSQFANTRKLHQVLGREDKPLAIYAMQSYFIELLKNSIDAIIENYFADEHKTTVLNMNIKVSIQDGKIVVTVSDNAGGFSEKYMAHFSQRLLGEKKLWQSFKYRDKKYLFGGNGFGLSKLSDLVLEGSEDADPVNQAMSLANNSDGAEITIITSSEPYVPSYESQQRKRKASPDLEQESGAQSYLFFAPAHKYHRVAGEPPKSLLPHHK